MARNISGTVIRQKPGDRAFSIVNYLIFGILTFLCAYPFYYLIINSISANDLSAAGAINLIPEGIHFQNYIDVFKLSGIPMAALVSVGRTVIGTVCTVLASAYLGFMCAMSTAENVSATAAPRHSGCGSRKNTGRSRL